MVYATGSLQFPDSVWSISQFYSLIFILSIFRLRVVYFSVRFSDICATLFPVSEWSIFQFDSSIFVWSIQLTCSRFFSSVLRFLCGRFSSRSMSSVRLSSDARDRNGSIFAIATVLLSRLLCTTSLCTIALLYSSRVSCCLAGLDGPRRPEHHRQQQQHHKISGVGDLLDGCLIWPWPSHLMGRVGRLLCHDHHFPSILSSHAFWLGIVLPMHFMWVSAHHLLTTG